MKYFMAALATAIMLAAVLAFTVQAAPFLVCNPQAGVTGYKLTGPSWVPTSVAAQTDGSIKMDVSASTTGSNSLTVQACKVDTVWGEQCSVAVPFVFTRPAAPTGPGGLNLTP